jgi:hypothetical protein
MSLFAFSEREIEANLFRDVFGTEDGRKLLATLAKNFHVYKTIQTPDPYVSAYQEGQRSVVIKIMEIIHTDLDAVRRRMEQLEDERTKRRQ